MPYIRSLLGRGTAVLIFCSPLFGQLTLSTIRGTAMDPTGAVVANSNIEVLQLETNAKREVVTSEIGRFRDPRPAARNLSPDGDARQASRPSSPTRSFWKAARSGAST